MSAIKRQASAYWLVSAAPIFVALYLPALRFRDTSIYFGTLYLFVAFVFVAIVRRVSISKKLLFSILAFNAVNLVSFFSSGFVLDDFVVVTLQYNFFFFVLLVFYSADLRVDRRMYWLACLFPLLYGLFLFFIEPSAVVTYGRFSATLDNPNAAGLYFLCITGICLGYSFSPRFGWLPKLTLLALLLVAVVLTGSFGGLFGYLLLVGIHYSWGVGGVKRGRFGRAATIFLAIALLYVSYVLFNQVAGDASFNFDFRSLSRLGDVITGASTKIGSFDERNMLNELAIERIFQSKDLNVIGFGLGQGRYSISLAPGDFTPVHNVLLTLVLEVGFVGLFFYCLIFKIFCDRFCKSRSDWIVFIAFFIGFFLTPAIYLPIFWVPTFFYFAAKDDENSVRHNGAWHRRRRDNAAEAFAGPESR
jgi:hypothetical protein